MIDGTRGDDAPGGLPPHDHAARRTRLREGLEGRWLLVSDPVHVRYLSGFTGSAGHLLVGPASVEDRILTDDRYEARVAREAADLTAHLTRSPVEVAVEHVGRGEVGALAVEADHLSWAQAREAQSLAEDVGIRIVGTTGAVARLRQVKDAAEIARLELANRITVDALAWLFEQVVAPGRTERELATTLERRFVDLGADGVAFPSIVASGPNSASPHHGPTDRRLEHGDLLTVDCGAIVDGYHADHTRTVGIGALDEASRDLHRVVLAAQQAGRAAARAGIRAGEVDRATRSVIEEAGLGERFVHGTGHGVGLQIHEAPSVARDAAATLTAGTAFTVEPGVYVPGLGGVRIEDSLVIDTDGVARVLAEAPRELRLL